MSDISEVSDTSNTNVSNDSNEHSRTRTYSWRDPMQGVAQFAAQSGLDALRAMIASGESVAPIMKTMNCALVEVDQGRAVFALTPAEYHYNPVGVVHGGVAATLLDSAMGISIQSSLPAGTTFTTLEMKVTYIRAMTLTTGPVRAEGTLVHLGRRMAVAEGRITDSAGKLYATASTTCLIIDIPQTP